MDTLPRIPIITTSPTFKWNDQSQQFALYVQCDNKPEWIEVRRPSPVEFKGAWHDCLLDVYVTETGFVYYWKTHKSVHVMLSRKGYLSCSIGRWKRYRIHRLVANLFVLNPDPKLKDQVNHFDGNKQNNHRINLEWVTNQENMQHAISIGLIQRKFTEEEIQDIRALYPGLTQQQIANEYDISIALVNQILQGNSYGDIPFNAPYTPAQREISGEANPHAKFTQDQVRYIRSAYPRISMDELGRQFNVDATCIGNIIKNITYYDPIYIPPSTERVGEIHHHAKLTQAQADEIRQLAEHTTHDILAIQFGVSRTTISNIVANQTYTNINYSPVSKKAQTGENNSKAKFTWDQIRDIREKAKTMRITEIAEEYGVAPTTLGPIVHNKTWYDPNYVPPGKLQTVGSSSHQSKLTMDQVKEIRAIWRTTTIPLLAQKYGVDSSSISNIIKNKTYVDPTYIPPEGKLPRKPTA